jgi:hypothetical protein
MVAIKRNRTVPLFVLTAITALALTACGSDTTTSAPITSSPAARASVASPTLTSSTVPTATATPRPAAATPSPTPVPTPTPKPAATPVSPPPPTPVPPGGNPWGYNFDPGSFIYSPPTTFCNYFNCIANFWNGRGYVMQCIDGAFGKSGGIQGSCSHHGGNSRPLFSH